MTQRYFRTADGAIKDMLSGLEKPETGIVEGFSFKDNPLDVFIMLARYKFAGRLLQGEETVLDAGCGHGCGTLMLKRFGRCVVGMDADPELVEHNRQRFADREGVSFEVEDLIRPARDHRGRFDAIVCLDVIEHFGKKEGDEMLSHFHEWLKEGGFAVIGTPSIRSQAYASERRRRTHVHEYEPREFREVLSSRFRRVFLFSMTDEVVSLSFPEMAWYLMGVAVK